MSAEVKAVREGVGVTEISNFAKYEVSGPGAEGVPVAADDQHHAEDGPHRADADAQRVRQADRRLHHRQGRRRPLHDLGLVQAQIYHMRWFERHLPNDGSVLDRTGSA
jgi:dimethylglycine dehydrogenase